MLAFIFGSGLGLGLSYFVTSKYILSVYCIIFGLPIIFMMIYAIWDKINKIALRQDEKLFELNENIENKIKKLSDQLDDINWNYKKYDRTDN